MLGCVGKFSKERWNEEAKAHGKGKCIFRAQFLTSSPGFSPIGPLVCKRDLSYSIFILDILRTDFASQEWITESLQHKISITKDSKEAAVLCLLQTYRDDSNARLSPPSTHAQKIISMLSWKDCVARVKFLRRCWEALRIMGKRRRSFRAAKAAR